MRANPRGVGRPREEVPPPVFDTLVAICPAAGWFYVYDDPAGGGQVSRPIAVWGLFESEGRRYIRGLGPEFSQLPLGGTPKLGDPRSEIPEGVAVTMAPKSVPP